MNSSIRIAHWTVGDIRRGLYELRALDDRHGYLANYGESWQSLLLSNPLATDTDLAISLVLDGDVVVGRLGYYAGNYRFRGNTRRTFWLQALSLVPEYRSSGVGGALLLQANERLPSFAASGVPSQRARQIYEAMGALKLGPLARFAAILDPTPLLYRYTASSLVAQTVGSIARLGLRLYNAMRMSSLPARPTLTFRAVQKISPEVGKLLEADPRFQMVREVATLDWVIGNLPFLPYQIYDGEKLVGYALFKLATVAVIGAKSPRTTKVMYLADFYLDGAAPEARRDLLAFALQLAREHGVERFETQVRGDILEQVCRGAGFLELEGNAAYLKVLREDRSVKTTPEEWFLTMASADVILSLGQEAVS